MESQFPKIGIMTWYTYRNYGTALQSVALYRKLKTYGYAPRMIQYPPKGSAVVRQKAGVQQITSRVKNAVKRRLNAVYHSPEREALFADWFANVDQTEKCDTYVKLRALNEEFDAFVCGSDQIWSPLCYDEKYFLSFVEHPQKQVAYAPSIGSTEVREPSVREDMAKWISRFTHLGVREQEGAELVRQLTGKQARVVADPTLLLNSAQWDELVDVPGVQKLPGEYIVCYFLGDAGRYKGYVEQLSRKTGLKAYVIPVTRREKQASNAVPFEVGPREFVSLIRNAAYVCTDSFHGLAFSLNYRRPFFVFKRFADNDPKNQNSRVVNLLRITGLQQRLVDPKGAPADALLSCDFSQAGGALEKLRQESEEYLTGALAQAVAFRPDPKAGEYEITGMCCGCGACAAVCPRGAITIKRNGDGFQHYEIDPDKCIRCGKCRTVCPYARLTALPMQSARGLYAARSTSPEVLRSSSSGGVAHELARYYSRKGYFVCGCAYDPDRNEARHILIEPGDEAKLPALQGSKYIQSITADAMTQIAALPKEAKLLFIGTPCQTAAVSKLLTGLRRRENAILVDLICHGVPSYHLWQRYLEEREQKDHTGAHPAVQFRQKELGWRQRQITVSGNGNSYRQAEHLDDFYAFFRRGLCDLESCFDCPYREHSGADLRLGDYWGPRFQDDREGVSMVVAVTEAGQRALEEPETLWLERQELSEYWTVQYPYNHPKPVFRTELIRRLRDGKKPLSQLRAEYCAYYDQNEALSKYVRKVKKLLRRG